MAEQIGREALEARVLEGLKHKLMAPEIAAEAMRAYADETNRLNRERRINAETDRKALADIERQLKAIIAAIEMAAIPVCYPTVSARSKRSRTRSPNALPARRSVSRTSIPISLTPTAAKSCG